MDGSFNQIIAILAIAGCCGTCLVWWFKRDLFLAGLVVSVFAVLIVGVVFTWPSGQSRSHLKQPRETPTQQEQQIGEAEQRRLEEAMLASLKTFESFRPAELPANGYVTSDVCRECHEHQHETWHASYHRKMTQVATPDAVLGNFDDVHVAAKGRDYHLTRFGEVSRVEMHDPDKPPSADSMIQSSIVMVTGSHHMQIYWYPARPPRTLGQLPIVYLRETDQWVPRSAVFLEPADRFISSEMGRWNEGCSRCHSTYPREREVGPAAWDTHAAEFGISCESCHGPGQEHVAFHRRTHKASNLEDPIVNPLDLTHERSSDVCGQCHGITSTLEDQAVVNAHGHSYRPGDELTRSRHLWTRDSPVVRKFLVGIEEGVDVEEALRRAFWDDGIVRVSGREHTGMIKSSCYQRGEMSCLSCHRMHQDRSDPRSQSDWANDQLSMAALDDQACTQCHEASDYGTQHTHHPSSSSGARCYNCHMPNTSYGLLKAMRSHAVFSPDVGNDLQAGRPNACNLCHLDKTLDWTAQTMAQWYETPIPELSAEQKTVAASLIWLLKGDAGERALAAWSMGWEGAHEASGTDWIAPFLARLLIDPYEAVRIITRRSLRSLPEYDDLQYNAVGPEDERRQVMMDVFQAWDNSADHRPRPEILIDESGVELDRVEELMKQRDDRVIKLVE